MIEYAAGLWSHAPKLGLAIVVIALVWGVVRIFRSRRPTAPARPLVPPMSPDDPANLDSSHIGGPLLESTIDPYGRRSGPITKSGSR
jgi:hypothetical protein